MNGMLPPNDTPADLYLLLGRIDGKVDGIAGTLAAMNTRTDRVEQRVGGVEHMFNNIRSDLDKIVAERGQMVPEFKTLIQRTDTLETWRTDVTATARTTSLAIRILWAVLGAALLTLGGWAVTAYVHSLAPVITHSEKTSVTTTIAAPAKP